MLFIEIDIRSQLPVYRQIMDQVQRLVREGRLEPWTSLPSVRQLAADLKLNPNTVAKAYSLLERDGILETARRRGSVVAGSAPAQARKAVADRLTEAVDEILERTDALGIDAGELLSALQRRLGKRASRRRST